jgi:hypothetical protein
MGYAIVNEEGRWRPVEYDEVFDQIDFKRIKVWVIGRIPYQLISAYDLDGDEYYTEPHFYCSFVNNGEPYEEIIYRGVAPSARKVDASPSRPFSPPGGLMEPFNASLQRDRKS